MVLTLATKTDGQANIQSGNFLCHRSSHTFVRSILEPDPGGQRPAPGAVPAMKVACSVRAIRWGKLSTLRTRDHSFDNHAPVGGSCGVGEHGFGPSGAVVVGGDDALLARGATRSA